MKLKNMNSKINTFKIWIFGQKAKQTEMKCEMKIPALHMPIEWEKKHQWMGSLGLAQAWKEEEPPMGKDNVNSGKG